MDQGSASQGRPSLSIIGLIVTTVVGCSQHLRKHTHTHTHTDLHGMPLFPEYNAPSAQNEQKGDRTHNQAIVVPTQTCDSDPAGSPKVSMSPLEVRNDCSSYQGVTFNTYLLCMHICNFLNMCMHICNCLNMCMHMSTCAYVYM